MSPRTPVLSYYRPMPDVGPFQGLLYDPAIAGELDALTAPPYDVIDAEALERFRARSPFNITWVDLGEGPYDDNSKYTHAGALIRRWRHEGVFAPVGPAVYPYEMAFRMDGRPKTVRGIILEVTLEAWGGSILPHERTMPGPIEDRMAQMRATRANISPLYALVRGVGDAQRDLIRRAMRRTPDREATDEDGVRHRLWADPDAGDLPSAYRDRVVLIADGHHRYETSIALRDELRAHGPGPWDAVMMFIVDVAVEDPPVLPYHRLVRVRPTPQIVGEPKRDLGSVLAALREDGSRFGAIVRTGDGVSYLLGDTGGDPPIVHALHEHVLDPMPGVTGLSFTQDAGLADRAVRASDADLAFLLPPARADDVQRVVEAGGRLPQKSTYFWPKLRTGLVIRPFDLV